MGEIVYDSAEAIEIANQVFEEISNAIASIYDNPVIDRNPIQKNNGQMHDGVSVRLPDQTLAPQIYIDSYVEKIMSGEEDTQGAVAECVKAIQANIKPTISMPVLDHDTALHNLRAVVVNTAANKEMLKETPHFEINDLAVYAKLRVEVGETEGTIRVTDTICPQLGMGPSEVLDTAVHNSMSEGYQINSLSSVVSSMIEMDIGDAEEEVKEDTLVITGKDMTYGAVGMFIDPTLRKEVHDRLGDYYLIPSSINETIALRDDGNTDPKILQQMVREVNETTVSPEEILSSEVYHVDQSLKISMACGETEKRPVAVETRHVAIRM